MTQPLTFETHNDPSCDEHPHCPFCGGVMADLDDRVVCANCGTDADTGQRIPAEPEPVAS